MDVYLGGRRVRLTAQQSIGKGGEADVYALGDDRALKLFKQPDHPDYSGSPLEQRAAALRIEEHQRKLPSFPRGLPPEVVVPLELATDRAGKRILGYTMQRVVGGDALVRYADPTARRRGLSSARVVELFAHLHGVVLALHRAGVTIGDFNDLNVLVTPHGQPRIIDADSFQFGAFAASVFTERFVDPRLCDLAASAPRLVQPYDLDADWYAFNALLFQSLLCTGPFGGLHKPRDPARRVPQGARALRRIWALHPEVVYPRPALDPRGLPESLLAHLEGVFVREQRGVFPARLLDGLRFTACPSCGFEHARARCPVCLPHAAAPAAPRVQARGAVHAAVLFSTRGVIVHASIDRGLLRVVHHEDGAYRREDGTALLAGPLDASLRFSTLGQNTLVGRDRELVLMKPGAPPRRHTVDTDGEGPAFASNGQQRVWCASGRLWRDALSPLAADELAIGDVLADQTRVFLGPRFGLGLSRAASLSLAFIFAADRQGLNDSLRMPRLPGQLTEVRCFLDEDRAWLLLAHAHGGRRMHRCLVYERGGALLAEAQADAHDGSWLGALGAKVATSGMLLCATSAGLCRVEVQGSSLVRTRVFPDTEEFVDESSVLLVGKEGLYVVGARQIAALRIA